MKQLSMPTLAEMREMLQEDLYVKFVWMWRDQEQDERARERRARFFGTATDDEPAKHFPSPMFASVASRKDEKRPASAELAQPRLKRVV